MIATKGLRVLVGERNTDLRILLKRSLEQLGLLVDDVDRFSKVMGRVELEDYDLALLDLSFSDVSAREPSVRTMRAPAGNLSGDRAYVPAARAADRAGVEARL